MSIFTNSAASSAAEAKQYISAILGLLGDRAPLDVLRSTEDALQRRVQDVPSELLLKREAPGKWAVNQVLQHLADSDLVWGWRLRMVLAHDRPQITGYDQDAWADRLHYDEADANEALEMFGVLRRANLRLVTRASDEDLERVGVHAERGEESVAHMMKLYAGHDLLHLDQIDRILATTSSPRIPAE
jgi:uncharacterized damage-inducible protein DinB